MTNGEKFKEVFGFKPQHCVAPARVCEKQNMKCRECPFDNFWDKEYKACFCIKEEHENNESVAEMLNKKKILLYESILHFLIEAEKQSGNYDGGGVEIIDWCRMMIGRSEEFRDKE